jgi:nicotinamide-nucleotide amidase
VEMREMMQGTILPELAAKGGPSALVSRTIRVTGIAESKVAEVLDDLFRASANPSIAYLASSGEVKIRLTAKARGSREAASLIEPLAAEVAGRLRGFVFTSSDEELEDVVGRLLKASSLTVGCAESLTGGGLAQRLSAAPGASAYFKGSAVCYTADAKRDVLGVSQETIDGPGVVSEECAREMARGARRIFGADLGAALTGVAGPDAHDGHSPGTVCVAVASDGGERADSFRAPGDRSQVQRWAEQAALNMLRSEMEGRHSDRRLEVGVDPGSDGS